MIRLWTEALEDVRDNDDVYALLLLETEKRSAQAVTSRQWQPVTDSSKVMKISPPQPSQERIHSGRESKEFRFFLEEIDKPVVAKIHGAAVGAGLDMALMCDVRIAGESASMSESYFNAGIVPGDGGAYFLPRLVGRDKALDLFWTARTLKGKEAADMGLVTHCVPDAELDAFVGAVYGEASGSAAAGYAPSQNAQSYRVSRVPLRASLDLISSFMGIVTELDDYRQRTSALVAKMQRKAQVKQPINNP